MEFRLLGPFEIEASEPVPIPRRRERCLLAVLLLEQGRSVAAHRLADLLWDGEPPTAAGTALRSHISRLRATLGTTTVQITRQGPGYLLSTDPEHIDAHRFRTLIQQARELTAPDRRASMLRRALDLWRGPVLADIATGLMRDRLGGGLEELRLEALDQRIGADLTLGRHRDVVAELKELAAAYPNREPFTAHLMLALYRAGRQADALRVYDESRRMLADELGLNPGPELRHLHGQILRADPAIDLPERVAVVTASAERGSVAPQRKPHQLPHDIATFTGRCDELAELDTVAAADLDSNGHAPTIISIDGAPGTGKTTLAVHWAHRVADRYPEVQLYVNLRGHGPGDPITPAAAAETLLRGLGVDSELIPPTVEERSALLRTTLAGRQVLMLLDNARDPDQIRPLLPGSDGLIIVTSRNQLRGLSIQDGAHRVTLHRLPHNQAIELLGTTIGADRVLAEPIAAARLVELCDHLPLALAIVAERATRIGTLAEIVRALEDEKARLDHLGTGEDEQPIDLRATLSWSYHALGDPAAMMFRKLGLHPANDIGADTAAALVDVPVSQAKALLDQLVAAHLVEQRRQDRYEQHDLIRLYALEMAKLHDRATDRRAAVGRVLDWYLYAAVSADSRLTPHRWRYFVKPYTPQTPPPTFMRPADATTWFEQEYDCLRQITGWAAVNGWAGHTWRIAMAMTTFFDSQIPWHDCLKFYELAHRAAQSAGENVGIGYTLNWLGCIYLDKGELHEAASYFRRSITCFQEVADGRGEAMSLGNLGLAYGRMGDDEGRRHSATAIHMYEALNDSHGIALNLDSLGVALTVAGEYKRAIDCHRQAHEINVKLGDAHSDAWNQRNLGCAYAGLGDTVNATRAFRAAISTYRAQGNRRWEAVVLTDFGTMLHSAGHPCIARSMWESALVIMKDFADPRARAIQSALATLP